MDHVKWLTQLGDTLAIHLAFRWITANPDGNEVEIRLWTGDRPRFLKSIKSWIPADNGELRGILRCQAVELTGKDFAEADFGSMISDVGDRELERKRLEEAAEIIRKECSAHDVYCPVDEFAEQVRNTGYRGNQPQEQLFSKAARLLRSKYLLSVRWSIEPMTFTISEHPENPVTTC